MLASILSIFATPSVINLAVQLIEQFMASKNASDEAKAAAAQLAAQLSALGVKGLKSRFDAEASEKQSGEDQWKRIETVPQAPPPILNGQVIQGKVVRTTTGLPPGGKS